MTIQMTYGLAMAAGQDAANRQMRKVGRLAWNDDDYNLAAETSARVSILAGILHVEAYADLGFGEFPYAQASNGTWVARAAQAA